LLTAGASSDVDGLLASADEEAVMKLKGELVGAGVENGLAVEVAGAAVPNENPDVAWIEAGVLVGTSSVFSLSCLSAAEAVLAGENGEDFVWAPEAPNCDDPNCVFAAPPNPNEDFVVEVLSSGAVVLAVSPDGVPKEKPDVVAEVPNADGLKDSADLKENADVVVEESPNVV
jgi:hypothetical protein